jgi:hypothetical protein
MHAYQNDAGALIAARYAVAGVDVTAGGAGDNTEVNGAWVDRQGFNSLKVVIAYTATIADAATLAVAANLQDASDDDGTGVADYGTALASTVQATGNSGGSTETGVVELDFDVSGADRYVRIQFTPNLSASGTDTAEMAAVYLLAGSDENPVTATAV